ncbi:hypothetical protein [Paractinoplanes toevensis]|uniref:Uncharacterized protein n=1 Tax=Paractinoplanes toevensis TaxID=571911 RepID=A0A919W441_9ACTN|nr:hypothetical protein [Actinoplanes toevensis]GIM91175.1 hypothetical protein Ato02nite_029680 [Actinoplanes toevensis]
MLIRGYAAIARRPWWFAAATIAVALLLGVVVAGHTPLWPVALGLMIAAVVASFVLGIPNVMAGRLPSFLLLRDGVFAAPARAAIGTSAEWERLSGRLSPSSPHAPGRDRGPARFR